MARKRANDRDAQRAIRQRTKEHVESLERQLDELRAFGESSKSAALDEAHQRIEALERELRQLKNCVASNVRAYVSNTAEWPLETCLGPCDSMRNTSVNPMNTDTIYAQPTMPSQRRHLAVPFVPSSTHGSVLYPSQYCDSIDASDLVLSNDLQTGEPSTAI